MWIEIGGGVRDIDTGLGLIKSRINPTPSQDGFAPLASGPP